MKRSLFSFFLFLLCRQNPFCATLQKQLQRRRHTFSCHPHRSEEWRIPFLILFSLALPQKTICLMPFLFNPTRGPSLLVTPPNGFLLSCQGNEKRKEAFSPVLLLSLPTHTHRIRGFPIHLLLPRNLFFSSSFSCCQLVLPSRIWQRRIQGRGGISFKRGGWMDALKCGQEEEGIPTKNPPPPQTNNPWLPGWGCEELFW